MYQNYYEILEVDKDSSQETIKKAYWAKAKETHPDMNPNDPGAEIKFKILNTAYNVLSDPEKRNEFDELFFALKESEEEGFKVNYRDLQIFLDYLKIMITKQAKYYKYDVFADTIQENFLILKVKNYEVDESIFKKGSIVSVRKKNVFGEGKNLEEFSLKCVIQLVELEKIHLKIVDTKKIKFSSKDDLILTLEDDPRRLFLNMFLNFDEILLKKEKYMKIIDLIKEVYLQGVYDLKKLGIQPPEYKKEQNTNKKFNDEQTELIKKTTSLLMDDNSLFVVCQGPGGTGKTECIVEIIKECITNKKRVLISSFTNVAVDNVFERILDNTSMQNEILRVAKDQVIKLPSVRKTLLSEKIKKLGKEKSTGEIIKEHLVIGATLDKLGFNLFDEIEFDLAIIDECSMVELPKLLFALKKSKKFLLIGDVHQLSPFLGTDTKKFLKEKGLKQSDIDYLEVSFFKTLTSYVRNNNPEFFVELKEQYRSSEEIVAFSNEKYYKNGLITKTKKEILTQYDWMKALNFESRFFKDILDPDKKVIWVDPINLPSEFRYSSNIEPELIKTPWGIVPRKKYFHAAQAAMTIMLIQRLLNYFYEHEKNKGDVGYRDKIGIISPYNNQVNLISRYLFKNPDIDPYINDTQKKDSIGKDLMKLEAYDLINELEIGTVHKFQGREKDFIIFNLTYFTGHKPRTLLNDECLLNVALLRAKNKVIIIGAITEDQYDYPRLHSQFYVNLLGLTELRESEIRRDYLLRLQGHKQYGSFIPIDINEYLRPHDQEFKRIFYELKNLEKTITYSDDEDILDEDMEVDKKQELLLKKIKFEETLNQLEKEFSEKDSKKYINYAKKFLRQFITNNEVDHQTNEKVKNLLETFLYKDIYELNKIEKESIKIEDKTTFYKEQQKKFEEDSIARFALQAKTLMLLTPALLDLDKEDHQ